MEKNENNERRCHCSNSGHLYRGYFSMVMFCQVLLSRKTKHYAGIFKLAFCLRTREAAKNRDLCCCFVIRINPEAFSLVLFLHYGNLFCSTVVELSIFDLECYLFGYFNLKIHLLMCNFCVLRNSTTQPVMLVCIF